MRVNAKVHRLLLVLFLSVCVLPAALQKTAPVTVQAAAANGWKQSGGYWYYYENGTKKTGMLTLGTKTYYLDAKGRMATGLVQLSEGRYYFDQTGAMVKNRWIKLKYWYYFGENGKAATNTFLTQEGKTYCVNRNGAMYTGLRTIDGAKYYFDLTTGVMQTGWVKLDGEQYYFDENGKMHKGWLRQSDGTYFFRANGRMAIGGVLNSKGEKYFFNNGRVKNNTTKVGVLQKGWIQVGVNWYYCNEASGIMAFGPAQVDGKKYYFGRLTGIREYGLKEINGSLYYFKPGSGEMLTDTKLTLGGVVYTIDKDGVASPSQDYIVEGEWIKVLERGRWYKLQKQFASHPGVADGTLSDDELLAALVYCEANDQGTPGMLAVAVTILNRVISDDTYYPNTLRYVIYQENQYAPVWDGALARRLANPKGEMYVECMNIVKSAKTIVNNYRLNGTKRVVKGFDMGKKTDFDYIYFMTPAAFERQKLDPVKCELVQHNGHVFFTKWVRKDAVQPEA